MTIDKTDVVDFIGIDNTTGEVILTIVDHHPWEGEGGDHLLLLQNKINTYLSFIESREMLETYPKAKGRDSVIRVVGKYPLSQQAQHFYNQATLVIEAAGLKLQFQLGNEQP